MLPRITSNAQVTSATVSKTVFNISRRTLATKASLAASPTTSEAPEAHKTEPIQTLPWPEYFKIRKNKQKWELATTLPSSLLGLGAGFAYFGSLDASSLIMGLDPMIIYGVSSLACGGLGWLLGPFIGGTFWRMSHRKALALIEDRDRTFHQHLVKNRVDPSTQSPVNPVPDFYGEKVGSLSQYRQWLRDQGKHRRKSAWLEKE